jgi:hypothetical protein
LRAGHSAGGARRSARAHRDACCPIPIGWITLQRDKLAAADADKPRLRALLFEAGAPASAAGGPGAPGC